MSSDNRRYGQGIDVVRYRGDRIEIQTRWSRRAHVGRRNPSARQAAIRSKLGRAAGGEEPVAASKVRRLSCREAISVNVGSALALDAGCACAVALEVARDRAAVAMDAADHRQWLMR